MIVPSNPNDTAAPLTRNINNRLIRHAHAVAQYIHIAAHCAGGKYLTRALQKRITSSLQDHFSALHAGLCGLDQAAVLEGAGKDADGVALERAQIDGAVGRGLHLESYTIQASRLYGYCVASY